MRQVADHWFLTVAACDIQDAVRSFSRHDNCAIPMATAASPSASSRPAAVPFKPAPAPPQPAVILSEHSEAAAAAAVPVKPVPAAPKPTVVSRASQQTEAAAASVSLKPVPAGPKPTVVVGASEQTETAAAAAPVSLKPVPAVPKPTVVGRASQQTEAAAATAAAVPLKPAPVALKPTVADRLSKQTEAAQQAPAAGVKPAHAPQVQQGHSGSSCVAPTTRPAVPFKPAVVPAELQAEPAFTSVSVPFKPATVASQQTEVASSSVPLSDYPAALPSQQAETAGASCDAPVPFRIAKVPFRPAVVPFKTGALHFEPIGAPAIPGGSLQDAAVAPPVPFRPAQVPLEGSMLPLGVPAVVGQTAMGPDVGTALMAASTKKLAVSEPAKTAGSDAPSTTRAGLPIVSSVHKGGLLIASPTPKAVLPIATPPPKAGLPIASPPAKADLPIASPPPKAAEATKLLVKPPSSRAPPAPGLLSSSHPLAQPATQPAPVSQQQQEPGAPTLTGTPASAVAAATVALPTHDRTEQMLTSQAASTQAFSDGQSVSGSVAVVEDSQKVAAEASGRRFPQARNQIVPAVKARTQAVSEPVAEAPGVRLHAQAVTKPVIEGLRARADGHAASGPIPVAEGLGLMDVRLDEGPARAASRRFPRARNQVVHAVKARALALTAGQEIRLQQTAATAAAGSSFCSKLASPAVPKLDLAQVRASIP